MKKKDSYHHIFDNYISKAPFLSYREDKRLGSLMTTEIISRNSEYSKLLKSYVRISRWRNVLKEVHKWLFFWGVIAAGFVVILTSYRIVSPIIKAKNVSLVIEATPTLITAFVSFISTITAIPLVIAKFLFNTKEDDNIAALITHTQEHDMKGIDFLGSHQDISSGKGTP